MYLILLDEKDRYRKEAIGHDIPSDGKNDRNPACY